MSVRKISVAIALCLAMAACSNMSSREQRTLSGAGLGAAGGAALGVLTGGASVAAGAAIGGAAGAAAGYLTDEDDISVDK